MNHQRLMRMIKRGLVLAVILTGAPLLYPAQIVPSFRMFTLKPGEKTTGEFTLVNNDNADIRVFPETKNWFVLPENASIEASSWLRVKDAYFILKKGDSRTVRFQVTAPPKATGELVGMVSFSTESAERTMLNFKISAAVYAGIAGTEKSAANIIAFSVQNATDAVQVGAVIENTGNVHLRPKGSVQVLSADGKTTVLNVSIELGGVTYPGNKKSYFGVVKDYSLKPGEYVAKINLFDVDRKVFTAESTKNFAINDKGVAELR